MSSPGFIQIMEFTTSDIEAVLALTKEWRNAEGRRRRGHEFVTSKRSNPDRYRIIVYFDSYESAMENSELPETQEFAGGRPPCSRTCRSPTSRSWLTLIFDPGGRPSELGGAATHSLLQLKRTELVSEPLAVLPRHRRDREVEDVGGLDLGQAERRRPQDPECARTIGAVLHDGDHVCEVVHTEPNSLEDMDPCLPPLCVGAGVIGCVARHHVLDPHAQVVSVGAQ